MNPLLAPFLLRSEEGPWFAVAGDAYRTLVSGAQTGGAFTLAEMIVPPGGGPPPHMHHREEETFFILEGEMNFLLGSKTVVAPVGTCVFGPRDVPHRFFNASDRPARLLVLIAPAGLEKFFAEFSQPLASRDALPPPLTPELIQKLLAIAPKYGLEILPPPV